MKICKLLRGDTTLVEDTLSDGSIVYDVIVGSVTFHARDAEDARWLWEYLSRTSKTIMKED